MFGPCPLSWVELDIVVRCILSLDECSGRIDIFHCGNIERRLPFDGGGVCGEARNLQNENGEKS